VLAQGSFWWIETVFGILVAAIVLRYVVKALRETSPGGNGAAESPQRSTASFLALWVFLPPLALYVLSQVWQPCLFDRYVVAGTLGLPLLLGVAVARIRWTPRVALVTVLVGFYSLFLCTLPKPWRPDWRTAAAYIDAHGSATAPIFIFSEPLALSFLFNAPEMQGRVFPVAQWSDLGEAERKAADEGQDFWVGVIRPKDRGLPSLSDVVLRQGKITFTMIPFDGLLNGRAFLHVQRQ
jgi:hypothetical protein